jgi:hypothetical protein
VERKRKENNRKVVGPTLVGEWRVSKNGGLEGEFGGVCKVEAYLEVLLELNFCTKPLNFGVEAHMEAPAGDALTAHWNKVFA